MNKYVYSLVLTPLCFLFLSPLSWGQAVQIDDDGEEVTQRSRVRSRISEYTPPSINFRGLKKVGLGVSTAGSVGLLGLSIELNFTPETSFTTAYGFSSNFQSFGFSLKRTLGGRSFSPYVSGGYARWFTSGDGGKISSTTPKFLASRFLSSKEKREGKFAENIIYPGFGVQFLQLEGDWAGSSVYAEVLMLIDVDDFLAAPTGGAGFIYYF